MEENKECKNCGSSMKKMDGDATKCQGCGTDVKETEDKKEDKPIVDESK